MFILQDLVVIIFFFIFRINFQDSVNPPCKLVQVNVNVWECMWVHELLGFKIIICFHMLLMNGHATKCLFILLGGSTID